MLNSSDPSKPYQVLLLPGWQNSGAQHWQSLWEAEHGDVRVQQHDWHSPRRGDWLMQLEEAVLTNSTPEQPVLLAAHSLGCHLVDAWAAHSLYTDRVAGALLVAPPDLRQADWPQQLAGWCRPLARRAEKPAPPASVLPPVLPTALPRAPQFALPLALPFASTVVAATNDPFSSFLAMQRTAYRWGSLLHDVGAAGHINADSKLSLWPQGRAWLLELPDRLHAKPATDNDDNPYID